MTTIKRTSLLIGAGSFLAIGAYLAPIEEASAQLFGGGCCVTYPEVEGLHDNTMNVLTERINAMELAVIEALRLGTGQLSGNMKEQIGADSNLANAQDDREVVGRIEQARMQAMMESASGASACNVITGSVGVASLGNNATSFSRSLATDFSDWIMGGEGMPSSQGADVGTNSRVEMNCTYATQQDVDAGLCEAVGEIPGGSTNAAQSLFYVAEGETSQTLSGDRLEAAKAFLLNAMVPHPLGPMLAGEGATPGGRAAAAVRQAQASRYSVATTVATEYLGRRAAQEDSGMIEYLRETTDSIPGYVASLEDGISWYDFMDIRARAWYSNPDWTTDMTSGNPAQAIKDLTLIQSYNAMIGWETFKLLEQQNVILAQLLSMEVDKTREAGDI